MQVVNLTPVVGLPKFDGWSQVIIDESKEFICCFAIVGNNAGNVGRDLVDFFSPIKPQSAQDLHQIFTQAITQVQQKDCQLSLSAGLFTPTGCILGTYQGNICLKRHEKVGQIVVSTDYIKIIEGKVNQGDIFVLTTQQGSSFLEEIQQKLNQGYDADTIITSIVPSLHNSPDSSLSAVAFVQILSPLATPSLAMEILAAEIGQEEPMAELTVDATVKPVFNTPVPSIPPVVSVKSHSKINLVSAVVQKITSVMKMGRQFIAPLFDHQVYVQQPKARNVMKKILPLLIGVILVIGLVMFRTYQMNQEKKSAAALLTPLTQQLTQAQTLSSSDPIAARELTEKTISELSALKESLAKQKTGQALVEQKLTETKQFYDTISGQEEFQQLPVFYDLRLAKADFIVNKSLLSGDVAYFWDGGLNQLVSLNLQTKAVATAALSPDFAIQDLTVGNKTIYLLGKGLYKLNPQNLEATVAKPADDVSQEPGLIGSYTEWLYVLSPAKKNIYRYESTDGKFGDPKAWLKITPNFDFKDIAAWSIDGDIWLTTLQGQVLKLHSGKVVDFKIIGLKEEFTSPIQIYTHPDFANIYLLEAAKHRLVVIDKEGKFIKEIKSGSLASGTGLLINEATKKAYVISGSLIFEIEI